MHGIAGNIATQKYEVGKNIQRHLQVITSTVASDETTRWRNFTPKYSISNFPIDQTELKTKKLNSKNEALAERLFRITQQDRRSNSTPLQNGWRKGVDGAFIDCYEDVHYEEVKRRFENNNEQSRQLRHDRRNRQNVSVHKYIAEQRSSYETTRLQREYEENRRLYKIFENKSSNTTLHLGLVQSAKKELKKKEKWHSEAVHKEREHMRRQVVREQRNQQLHAMSPKSRTASRMKEAVKNISSVKAFLAVKDAITSTSNVIDVATESDAKRLQQQRQQQQQQQQQKKMKAAHSNGHTTTTAAAAASESQFKQRAAVVRFDIQDSADSDSAASDTPPRHQQQQQMLGPTSHNRNSSRSRSNQQRPRSAPAAARNVSKAPFAAAAAAAFEGTDTTAELKRPLTAVRDFALFSPLSKEEDKILRTELSRAPLYDFDALVEQSQQRTTALSPNKRAVQRPFTAAAYGTVESFLGVENGQQFLEESGYRDIGNAVTRSSHSDAGFNYANISTAATAVETQRTVGWSKLSHLRKNVSFGEIEEAATAAAEVVEKSNSVDSQSKATEKVTKQPQQQQQQYTIGVAQKNSKVPLPPHLQHLHHQHLQDSNIVSTSPVHANYTHLGYHSTSRELIRQLSSSEILLDNSDNQQPTTTAATTAEESNDSDHAMGNDKPRPGQQHQQQHHHHHHSSNNNQHHHHHHHYHHHHGVTHKLLTPHTPQEVERQKREYLEQFAREEREESERLNNVKKIVLRPIDAPGSRERDELLFAVRRGSLTSPADQSLDAATAAAKAAGDSQKSTTAADEADDASVASSGSDSSSSSSGSSSSSSDAGSSSYHGDDQEAAAAATAARQLRFRSAAAVPSSFSACEFSSRSSMKVQSAPVAVINSARVQVINSDGSSASYEPGVALQQRSIPQQLSLIVSDVTYMLPCASTAVLFTDDFSKVHAKEISERRRLQMRRASARVLSRGRLPGLDAMLQGSVDSVLPLNSTNAMQVQPAPASYGIAVQVSFKSTDSKQLKQQRKQQQQQQQVVVEGVASLPSLTDQSTQRSVSCILLPVDQLAQLAEKHNSEDVQRLVLDMQSFSYEFGVAPRPIAATATSVSNKTPMAQLTEEEDEENETSTAAVDIATAAAAGDKLQNSSSSSPVIALDDDANNIIIYPQLSSMLDGATRRALCDLVLASTEVEYDQRTQQVQLRLRC